MMKAFPLDFYKSDSGLTFPKDKELHRLALEFAEKELAQPVNLSELNKVWVICEMDGEKIGRVVGLNGYTMRPDFTLCRFTSPEAAHCAFERAENYLADNGARGMEVLVRLSSDEAPEQRCPDGLKTMIRIGGNPADRWILKVR